MSGLPPTSVRDEVQLDAIVSFLGGVRAVFGEQIERLRLGGRRQSNPARRRSSGSSNA